MGVRNLTMSFLLTFLAACPSDPPGDASTGEGTTMDDDDGSTSSVQTGTSEPTSGPSTTTTDPGTTTTGVDDSSSSSGPGIGCTPGDPCCNDAGEFEECWIDDATGLVWELSPGGGNPTAADAFAYCEQLELLGSGGWRLPTIDELRTLVRGCPDTMPGGACGLTDDCADQDCHDASCDGCADAPEEGPGMFGCYWNPNLLGTCERYWSATNTGTGLGWLVDFNDASVRQADAALPAGLVRCVAN